MNKLAEIANTVLLSECCWKTFSHIFLFFRCTNLSELLMTGFRIYFWYCLLARERPVCPRCNWLQPLTVADA